MGHEQFQKPHDQRPRQPQKRAGKGRGHAAKLRFQPGHQLVENLDPGFAVLGRQGPDRVHDRRHRRRQAVERAQKPQKDQQIRQIAGDIAGLVDARRHRFQNRARAFGRDHAPRRPMLAQKCGQGRQQARRIIGADRLGRVHAALGGIAATAGETLDPADRFHQFGHLPQAAQHAHDEDRHNQPVQPAVRGKDRQDPAIGEPCPGHDQPQHNQHQDDLAHRLRELRRRGNSAGRCRARGCKPAGATAAPLGCVRPRSGRIRVRSGQVRPPFLLPVPTLGAGSQPAKPPRSTTRAGIQSPLRRNIPRTCWDSSSSSRSSTPICARWRMVLNRYSAFGPRPPWALAIMRACSISASPPAYCS